MNRQSIKTPDGTGRLYVRFRLILRTSFVRRAPSGNRDVVSRSRESMANNRALGSKYEVQSVAHVTWSALD